MSIYLAWFISKHNNEDSKELIFVGEDFYECLWAINDEFDLPEEVYEELNENSEVFDNESQCGFIIEEQVINNFYNGFDNSEHY